MGPDDERPVLVAPDAFKGSFSAADVADAIAEGLEAEGVPADRCPIADGGEGTADVLRRALGGEQHELEVTGPLGAPVRASFTMLGAGGAESPGSAGQRVGGVGLGRRGSRPGPRTAIVEVAAASGLPLLARDDRNPLLTSTTGTGELIAAAITAGAEVVLVGCGGSATVDGGAGALAAIEEDGGLRGAKLICLCDARVTWARCAAEYGPQKGADAAAVALLQTRLAALARTFPVDPSDVPMSGAAGGLAGGLFAVHGAMLAAGAPYVLDAIGADARMRAARFVIVGEGRIDRTTLDGKGPGELATRARQGGVPCHAVVGENAMDPLDSRIIDLMEIIEATTRDAFVAAGRLLAAR